MKKGFTLLEVMIALSVIGTAVTVIISFAGTLYSVTKKSARATERIGELKNMLRTVESDPAAQKKQERGFPVLALTYTKKPVAAQSALADIKNLVIEKIEAQWTDGRKRTDTLYALRYEQPSTKEEKK